MSKYVVPSTAKQVQTQKILHEYRKTMLGEKLRETASAIDPDVLHEDIAIYVEKESRRILQGKGIREETVFALPSVLNCNQRLLGYYRLLIGVSEKQFYASSTGLSVFQSMEHMGSYSRGAEEHLPDLCKAINEAMASLLHNIDKQDLSQDLADLPLMTLGAYSDGVWRNIIGTQAALHVFDAIKSIVSTSDASILINEEKCLRFRNTSGNIYRVTPSSDPDISIIMEGNTELKVLCIEIKGGQDVANVHNRAGEAEKAHLKATQGGWREKWTVIYLVGLQDDQREKLLTESPSTDEWFDVNEVCAKAGDTYEAFKKKIKDVFQIK